MCSFLLIKDMFSLLCTRTEKQQHIASSGVNLLVSCSIFQVCKVWCF